MQSHAPFEIHFTMSQENVNMKPHKFMWLYVTFILSQKKSTSFKMQEVDF